KYVSNLFFFFQAEDGIRDGHVTGVQTCALPICELGRPAAPGGDQAREAIWPDCRLPARHQLPRRGRADGTAPAHAPARRPPARRSEERRVGKECRFGGGVYGEKKKSSNVDIGVV